MMVTVDDGRTTVEEGGIGRRGVGGDGGIVSLVMGGGGGIDIGIEAPSGPTLHRFLKETIRPLRTNPWIAKTRSIAIASARVHVGAP